MFIKQFIVVSVIGLTSMIAISAQAGGPDQMNHDVNWTGFSVGLNGGYGWGDPSITNVGLEDSIVIPDQILPATLNPSFGGGILGAQVGFDRQIDDWGVLGLKYAMDWSNMSGSTSVSPFQSGNGFLGTLSGSAKLTWFGDLLLRFGFLPRNHLLVYGTAGFAFGHISNSTNADGKPQANVAYPGSISKTAPGWTAGAGIEWLMKRNWSLATEYLYSQLETTTANTDAVPADPGVQMQSTYKTNYQTITLAVNYRF